MKRLKHAFYVAAVSLSLFCLMPSGMVLAMLDGRETVRQYITLLLAG